MTLQVFGFEHQLDNFKLLSYWAGIQFSKKEGKLLPGVLRRFNLTTGRV